MGQGFLPSAFLVSSSNLYIKLILVYSQIYHFSPFTQLSTLHRLTLPASFQIVKTSHNALRALSYFHSYTSTVATRPQTANKTPCIRLVCEEAPRLPSQKTIQGPTSSFPLCPSIRNQSKINSSLSPQLPVNKVLHSKFQPWSIKADQFPTIQPALHYISVLQMSQTSLKAHFYLIRPHQHFIPT